MSQATNKLLMRGNWIVIEDLLHKSFLDEQVQCTVVAGAPRRSGKTEFLRYIDNFWTDEIDQVYVCTCDAEMLHNNWGDHHDVAWVTEVDCLDVPMRYMGPISKDCKNYNTLGKALILIDDIELISLMDLKKCKQIAENKSYEDVFIVATSSMPADRITVPFASANIIDFNTVHLE